MKVLAIKSSPNMLMANTHLILKTFIDGMKQTGSEVELSCYKKIEYYTLFLLLFILDSDS